jgi:hypothetical protein
VRDGLGVISSDLVHDGEIQENIYKHGDSFDEKVYQEDRVVVEIY